MQILSILFLMQQNYRKQSDFSNLDWDSKEIEEN